MVSCLGVSNRYRKILDHPATNLIEADCFLGSINDVKPKIKVTSKFRAVCVKTTKLT